MNSIVFLTTLLSSVFALADNFQCLQRATNSELVSELSYRLGANNGGGDVAGGFSVSFTCGGNAEVIINSTNLSTGTNQRASIPTGNWDSCRSISSLLNTKIGNVPLTSGRIFAICGGNAEIKRTLVNADSIKQISSDATGNWDTCRKQADLINQNLTK
jgi:hypothetical protein